jgi:fructan beta-fructosidase
MIRQQSEDCFKEPYRPQVHFTPLRGWMNDPGGLVFYDGDYHLFYQYIPDRMDHDGALHWGHAKSSDLVHWIHLSPALYPDHNGDIWSGSIVIDWNNTSKLQTGKEKAMIAIFTQENKGRQEQGLAYSTDRGYTWTMYPENPVLPNPGYKDFRDPKVFWHEESNLWIMIIAAGCKVIIYQSQDLKDWILASEFGEREGLHTGIWECPDLFELAIDDDMHNKKWVMLVSMTEVFTNRGSGTQYFIGDFDGKKFNNLYPNDTIYPLDYGKDNYAGVTFSDIPPKDGRRILISWMSNWQYARKVPTSPWRGAMTVPRELTLANAYSDEIRLVSLPVKEMNILRDKKITVENCLISYPVNFPLINRISSGAFEIQIEFEVRTASEFGLLIRNENGDSITVGCNLAEGRIFIDRGDSGYVNFDNNFAGKKHSAPLLLYRTNVKLNILLDLSSIEVFADNGRAVLTDLVFPKSNYDELQIYSLDGNVQLMYCTIWELKSIWHN